MSKRHEWDLVEDMVVCSHTMKGDVNTKKVRKAICEEYGIDERQLKARVHNFKYLLEGGHVFWHTSKSERLALKLLCKHGILLLIK